MISKPLALNDSSVYKRRLAQDIGNDHALELVLEGVQIRAHRRVRQAPGVDEVQHFGVGVKAFASQLPTAFSLRWNTRYMSGGNTTNMTMGRRARPVRQLVVGGVHAALREHSRE